MATFDLGFSNLTIPMDSVEEKTKDRSQNEAEVTKAKPKKRKMSRKEKTFGLPKEAYQECLEAFRLFDKDGSGTISYDELADVMRLLGNNPTEKDLQEMMEGLDSDDNGTVDFQEFMTLMTSHWKDPVDEQEELLHAFEVFDRNKDGFVVAEEIKYVMKNLGHMMTDADIDTIIKEGDVDGDGRLDYHEFVKVMQARL